MQVRPVIVDYPSDGVLRLTLNRPEKRNALTAELREAILEAFAAAVAAPSVRSVILAGAGGNFCAGGDLESLEGMDPEAGRRRIRRGHDLVRALLECDKPIVAAVEGYAMGAGAGLAMAADTLVVDAAATIGFPFLKVGLGPDFGVSHLLPRRVGPHAAAQLLMRARNLKGEAAVRIGLADELAPLGTISDHALAVAREYCDLPAQALALVKRQTALAPQSLESAMEREATVQALCFASAEFAEGVAAFRGKRRPIFNA
jgi:2-(1,2-epoxy-1,2-dihydrophenyl)acetyl-CoA isomerase